MRPDELIEWFKTYDGSLVPFEATPKFIEDRTSVDRQSRGEFIRRLRRRTSRL